MGTRIKIFKNIFLSLFVPLLIIYCTIYFALPYFANKNDYSKKITNIIKQETGLIFLIDNYKLEVSPALNLTIKADEIQGFYPNKTPFLIVKKANINVSTLNLIKKEIKINKIKSEDLQFSTKLLKTGKTTFQEYIDHNVKNSKTAIQLSEKVPDILINQYVFKLKDEESGQKFKIKGKQLKIVQSLDSNYANFETKGEFYCFDKKYTTYNIKTSVPKNLFKDLNKKLFDINTDNINKYNFYADLIADIKIYEKNGEFDTFSGKVHIDNFSMQLGSIKLPQSHFYIEADKKKATILSKFYTGQNEFTDINASFKIKKPYELNIKCNCKSADIQNLRKITITVSEILKIPNSIKYYKTNGNISANFNINTDFKTIKSNGTINITNTNISHKDIPFKINNINSLIDFNNNNIEIKNTRLLVNDQPIKIYGKVNTDTTGEISISAKNLEIKNILKAIPTIQLPSNIYIKNGKLSFITLLNGKLQEATPLTKATITDLVIYDSSKTLTFNTEKIALNIKSEKDKYSGNAKAEKIKIYSKDIPNNTNSANAEQLELSFNNKDVTIVPAKLNLGDAKLILSGKIKNFITIPDIDINASGTIDTKLIKTFMPKDATIYTKGYIPIKSQIKGKPDNIKINIKALANPTNYITPIHIKSCENTNTLTILNGTITPNNLQIEDFSIYVANNINNLLTEINTNKLKKLISTKGKIKNYKKEPYFDNLTVNIPNYIKISVPDSNNGTVDLFGTITLNEKSSKPLTTGNITLKSISIPKYNLKADAAAIFLTKTSINTQINAINIANTKLSINSDITTDFLKTKKINYLKIDAETINMNDINSLLNLLPSASYAPGVEALFNIDNGKINIKNFIMNPISATNITGDISLNNNIFNIKNLTCNAYGGNIVGNIKYNLPYISVNTQLQGRGMNAESATTHFLPKEQRISGQLNFDSNLNFIGFSEEQLLKTIKGDLDVVINNGHLGQLGRFEHFLYAQNLLSQKLINTSLNSAKQAISPKDTGNVTYLKGKIKLSNGLAKLNPVTTSGPQMSMYINGNINLLSNYTDLEILGKVSAEVSNSLGTFGSMTIKEFLEEHTNIMKNSENTAKEYETELPQMDISKIPNLSPDYKYQTKNFRVLIIGDPNSIKSVKSFTWVSPINVWPKTQNSASQSNSLQKPNNYQNNIQQNTTKQTSDQASQPSFLENIPDYFHD